MVNYDSEESHRQAVEEVIKKLVKHKHIKVVILTAQPLDENYEVMKRLKGIDGLLIAGELGLVRHSGPEPEDLRNFDMIRIREELKSFIDGEYHLTI